MKLDPRLSLALLLAGCQGAPLPDTSVAEVSRQGESYFHATPRVTTSQPADGLARTQVNLTIEDAVKGPGFSLLALPNTAWSQVMVSLYSPSVNVAYDPTIHQRTVSGFGASSNPSVGSYAATGNQPFTLAVDAAGTLYVVSSAGIKKVAGGVVSTFSGTALNGPLGAACDAAGNLYVAETGAQRILRFAPNGTMAVFFTNGAFMADPKGLRFDALGNLYVAEGASGKITRITPAGAASDYAAGLTDPLHLAFDHLGNLYVTSGGADTVSQVATNGSVTPAWFTSAGLAPGGIVFSNGALYLTRRSTSADLYKLTTDTKALTTFAANGGTSSGDYFFDLALDGDGNFYAPEHANGTVWRTVPDTHYTGSATFPPLRPAADYTAQVFLQNPAGGNTLSGSQAKTNLTLVSGLNALDFLVKVNGSEASYQLTSSANANVITGNAFVQDDVVTLATGVDAGQPGVDRLVIELSGPAYGGTACTVAVLTSGTPWASYTWNAAAPASLPGGFTGAAAYVPAKLTPGTGLNAVAGTLAVKAYDVRNNLVGSSAIPLAVYGKPGVTLDLR